MKKLLLSLIGLIFFYNVVEGQCAMRGQVISGVRLSTTGSPKLDGILAREGLLMQTSFDVKVNLYAYEDGSSPNALAYADESVIQLGKTLLLDEFVTNGNENSIIAIMAHEFGHIVQAKYNLNADGTWIGKYPELHADFMAGWYMGTKQYISKEELYKMTDSFWAKGDGEYFSPFHHGTSEERAYAFIMGFYNANLGMGDAYNKGIDYVINIDERIKQSKTARTKTEPSQNTANTPAIKTGKAVIFIGEGKMKKAEIYLVTDVFDSKITPLGTLDKTKNENQISVDLAPGTYGISYKSGTTEGWAKLVITGGQTTSLDILDP